MPDYFRDMPPDQQYFVQSWLNSLSQIPRAEGYRWRADDPNYDYALAMALGIEPVSQMGDPGPYGPRPHWVSKTPAGSWLKAETHPTHWREDESVMINALNKALMGY